MYFQHFISVERQLKTETLMKLRVLILFSLICPQTHLSTLYLFTYFSQPVVPGDGELVS